MLKQLWQSLTGKDDAKTSSKSMVAKQDRSGETDDRAPEPPRRRELGHGRDEPRRVLRATGRA